MKSDDHRQAVLEYTEAILDELRVMVSGKEQETLVYLLDLARFEAARLRAKEFSPALSTAIRAEPLVS